MRNPEMKDLEMKPPLLSKTEKNGFTLIELMVALAVFGLVVAGIMTSKTTGTTQNITQLQAVEMQQRARAAMFMMKKELRQAGFNNLPVDYGQGVTHADRTSIEFSFVADESGTLDTIRYELLDRDADGDTDLARTINGGLDTLAENITAPPDMGGARALFEYYDGSVPPVQLIPDTAGFDPARIRIVDIRIIARIDIGHRSAAGPANSARMLASRVLLRNMGM